MTSSNWAIESLEFCSLSQPEPISQRFTPIGRLMMIEEKYTASKAVPVLKLALTVLPCVTEQQ